MGTFHVGRMSHAPHGLDRSPVPPYSSWPPLPSRPVLKRGIVRRKLLPCRSDQTPLQPRHNPPKNQETRAPWQPPHTDVRTSLPRLEVVTSTFKTFNVNFMRGSLKRSL